MLGRGEDTHGRAAHILISTLFSPSSQETGRPQRATRQEAPSAGNETVERFHFHPEMRPWGLRKHPHFLKSQAPGNRLCEEGGGEVRGPGT